MSDEELQVLFKCCLRKDRKCQELMYAAFYGYGTNLAYHYVNDVELSKVIYNDSMLKFFLKLDTFNAKSEIKTWLHRIIINTAIDYNRSKINLEIRDIELAESVEESAYNVESKLYGEDILQLIFQLSTSYRTVFLLHVLDGFTFKEIAEKLAITEGGAKGLYFKAKQKLQVLLKTHF